MSSVASANLRRASTLLRLGLLALLLAIVGLGVSFLTDARAQRLGEKIPEVVAAHEYVILAGQEPLMREMLAPLDAGALPGVEQFSFSTEGRLILVQLFNADTHGDAGCPGPEWGRTPGVLFLRRGNQVEGEPPVPSGGEMLELGDLRLHYYWCEGEAPVAGLEQLLAGFAAYSRLAEIWQPVTPEQLETPHDGRPSGLLRPAAEWSGLDHERLTIFVLFALVFASAFVAMAAGPTLPGPLARAEAPPRWVWLVMLVLVLATLALRLQVSALSPLDGDETWAWPSDRSIFLESHDVWVHPPLFHMVQQPWARSIAWEQELGVTLLRLPMIAAGTLAVVLVLAFVTAHARPAWLLVLALPCALSPDLALASILARPYALAALLVTITAVALWAPTDPGVERSAWGARLRWWVILLAAGLAGWADLLAGAAAGSLVVARLLSDGLASAPEERTRKLVAGCVALALLGLAVLPLVPGALQALDEQIDPNMAQAFLDAQGYMRPGDVLPDPDLTQRLPAFCVFGLDLGVWPVGLVAILGLVGLAVHGWRTPSLRVEALVPALWLVLWLVLAAGFVHLRARNVCFVPLVVAILAAVVVARPRAASSTPSSDAVAS